VSERSLAEHFFLEAMSPAGREDPYPLYESYRSGEPLLRADDTIWIALDHAAVLTVLRHPALSSDERHATSEIGKSDPATSLSRGLLFMDPPDHTRLRGLIARAFTPKRIADLRPIAESITAALLDGVCACRSDQTVDLIGAFAYPLPIGVISALLGVPVSDQATFTAWSRALARSVDPTVLRSPEIDAAISAAERELAAYLTELLARRRRAPGDDLLSALVAVEADGDRISAQEVVDLAMLLLIAGHETTVNLIGNGLLALLRNPDQLARLRRAPELVPAAVDELLRFDGPVQLSQRVAVGDLDLCGRRVRGGDEIMLVLGAANRDPAVFAEPSRLDVTRDARAHVAFGGGIHHCLGAALARLEGQVAFAALLDRTQSLELAGVPTRRPTFTLRGLETLPVALAPRAATRPCATA
jgi:cytochrome P450